MLDAFEALWGDFLFVVCWLLPVVPLKTGFLSCLAPEGKMKGDVVPCLVCDLGMGRRVAMQSLGAGGGVWAVLPVGCWR